MLLDLGAITYYTYSDTFFKASSGSEKGDRSFAILRPIISENHIDHVFRCKWLVSFYYHLQPSAITLDSLLRCQIELILKL